VTHALSTGRIYASWSHRLVGSFSLTVTEAGTVTYSTNRFWHGDYTKGAIDDFRAQLQTDLTILGVGTWTVTWSNTTLRYVLTNSASVELVVDNELTRKILGFATTGSQGTGTTFSPTLTPIYILPFQIDGQNYGRQQETDLGGSISSGVTDDGVSHGFASTTRGRVVGFSQDLEPKISVRPYYAGGTDYKDFTWEDLFEHAGVHEELILRNDKVSTTTYGSTDVDYRFKLTGDGALFAPEMTIGNNDVRWNIPFTANILERFK
jgi:hypothetical protein